MSSPVTGGRLWGGYRQTVECDNCGKRFALRRRKRRASADDGGAGDNLDHVVDYDPQPIKCECPACGAVNPPVTQGKKNGIRQHKCQCGHCFKSVDITNDDD